MMDSTATVILVSIFVLAAVLIALPRVLGRGPTRPHSDEDRVDAEPNR